MGLKFHVISFIFLILTSWLALGSSSKNTDIALTGVSGWASIPVAFSNGNGTFNVTNKGVASFPGWAATANAKVLTGDFNEK
jgi:hypothetical protein